MEVRESKGITETIRQKLGLGMIEETCILDYAVCDRIAETIMDYCDRKIKLKIVLPASGCVWLLLRPCLPSLHPVR